MSALERITDLPSGRIPSRIKHADILKILMVHCKNFSFGCSYLHVKAHQDDRQSYYALTRPAQLNCQVDFYAKSVIWGLEGSQPPPQDMLPLEALGVFAGKTKITSGRGDVLRYWAHRTVAKRVFTKCKILMPDEFDEVAWRAVHSALWEVPRMFQIWATKQVMEIAGTNEMQSKYKEGHDKMCPSCSCRIETCGHVLFCQEEGRVDVLEKSIDLLDDWLIDQNTNEPLRFCIIDYARGRGGLSMREVVACVGKATEFRRMAASQDKIGWRRFMEGMISKEILNLHYSTTCDSEEDMPTPSAWAKGLVIKLLEATHGQWLYRNVHVHDCVSGSLATARKEELQRAIEDELELGGEGLAEEDLYLLEINLDDLETTSGELQAYWLLSIRAAREWRRLQTSEAAQQATEE
jgi:hypothetical protein